MPKQPRLMNRNGRWVYRVRVPDALVPGIGKRELWRSFGAVDFKEASRLGRLQGVRIDALFEQERARLIKAGTLAPPPASTLTHEDIYRVVRAYFYRLEKGTEPVPFDDSAREHALEAAVSEASAVHSVTVEDANIQTTAMAVAADAHLGCEKGSPLFWELVSAVKHALDEHLSREVDRLSLQPVANHHPDFADITAANPPRRTMTLAQAVAAFKAAPEKSGRSRKTRAAWDFRFAAWEDLLGAGKRVSEISRKDVQNARDILLVVPPNAAKRWPKKPLAKIADIARRDKLAPMHPKSVQLYLEALTSLLKWLVQEGELDGNPAVGVGAPAANNLDQPRRPLTVPELQRLFRSGPFSPPIKERGWRFWVPLIGLFQGMRIAEIVGLSAADVSERDGVHVITVKPNSARSLKTVQSTRLVPVHPKLAALGFVEFVKKVPPTGPLFAGLPGKRGDSGNASQKAIARWVRSVFPDDEAVVFHSLRHTWTDALRNVYVPREIMERLGGWKASGGSAMHGYGDGYRASVLAAEIAKVAYPDLDLDHLHPVRSPQPSATQAWQG